MGFHDELSHPGKLPEPFTLVSPVDIGDPDGVLFTCESSENVVMYHLRSRIGRWDATALAWVLER